MTTSASPGAQSGWIGWPTTPLQKPASAYGSEQSKATLRMKDTMRRTLKR